MSANWTRGAPSGRASLVAEDPAAREGNLGSHGLCGVTPHEALVGANRDVFWPELGARTDEREEGDAAQRSIRWATIGFNQKAFRIRLSIGGATDG